MRSVRPSRVLILPLWSTEDSAVLISLDIHRGDWLTISLIALRNLTCQCCEVPASWTASSILVADLITQNKKYRSQIDHFLARPKLCFILVSWYASSLDLPGLPLEIFGLPLLDSNVDTVDNTSNSTMVSQVSAPTPSRIHRFSGIALPSIHRNPLLHLQQIPALCVCYSPPPSWCVSVSRNMEPSESRMVVTVGYI